MHDLFEIRSASGSHPVRLADRPLAEIVAARAPALVIADAVFRDALAGLSAPVLFVEAVEEAKELGAMPALIGRCRAAGLARDGRLVAVGGGVIQDLAGFVASVYMRGVAWSYLPTTLLAMVDSCIGGKTSINVGEFKNLIGTFYPPDEIVAVPAVLATLAPEHVAAGRCEAAKICYARGPEAFARYLELDGPDGIRDEGALIALSLASKKWFVEIDEFDRAERLLLNFGHSWGHALESCTHYAVPHGVAVGIGCVAAIAFGAPSGGRVDRLRAQLHAILAPVDGIREALAQVDRATFFRYFDSDKKHSAQNYRLIVVAGDGALERTPHPRTDATRDRIWRAFAAARDALR